MLFDFILKQSKPDVVKDFMVVRGRQIPLAVVRNHRARRYLLRLRPDGSVRYVFLRHRYRQAAIELKGICFLLFSERKTRRYQIQHPSLCG
jgi:hypothetical protein